MSQVCCSTEVNIQHKHSDGHDHDHDHGDASSFKTYVPAIFSLVMLLAGIAMDYFDRPAFFQNEIVRIIWYLVAYIPVGFPVFKEAFTTILKGEFFTEFTLMTVATIGAFILGEYPEGVAVMLFYAVGELFQNAAVNRAKNNIKALLDVRPEEANVFRNNQFQTVKPETVEIGETIQIKVGEKVPLDGIMLSESSSFNTAALTGESKPDTIRKGETVLAGMLNLEKVIELQTTKKFEDSSLAKILQMVQEASSRKAKTELFIRKFAKVYTPIVFFLAVAVAFLPYFFVENYDLKEWIYRALIFLVISCPCALVISIPLGYFGGIGAASRNGILFKGSNFLDLMAKVNTVVMDKTGTLTEGVFKVQKIEINNLDKLEFLNYVSALEANSTHPIAQAIVAHHASNLKAENIEEISGHGLKGEINGKTIWVGNGKLLKKFGIEYPPEIDSIVESIVIVAIENNYAGHIIIADEIKEDSLRAISEMKKHGVTKTLMLSGDKDSIVQKVAKEIGISTAFGGLLPEGKLDKLKELKNNPENTIAFVGDGINDAPVLALADIGIAMGGMGSDVAIETADVVIQTDQPSKISTAIKIGRKTKQIVIQNIALAFGVKLIVLILGAGGLATMWEAVFADVGVAFLAILNAIRIQKMKF
ncbi:heavy metal translocating P-type ATPase [Moheibacter lacus]|uniref:P-type Zn(2+) transporter n=1 Tax=Moheibacter lacus TaxID=2745851 RepID=A0A838ZHR9_9FLAO|nr:heavy metal translocating P-type ATPase [Moheibacter lacus]MBA5628798.1 cadmium-translocating P-type ATPase [Moheibacter lacus]